MESTTLPQLVKGPLPRSCWNGMGRNFPTTCPTTNLIPLHWLPRRAKAKRLLKGASARSGPFSGPAPGWPADPAPQRKPQGGPSDRPAAPDSA